jgi:hypothetical protein
MWDELGIPETTDVKAIRKAYATRLKAFNRKADDQAFAKLHVAYQAAIAWAERNPGIDNDSPISEIVFLHPAPPPAMAPVPDDEALRSLGAQIDTLLNVGQFQDAIGAYDQGMARGILPLGDANPYLDRIMDKAITTLPPAPFVALMRRVGWEKAPFGRYVSNARHAAAGRLEAESWFRNLEQEAARLGKPKAAKGTNSFRRFARAMELKAQQRNARLLLIDKPQLFRYRLTTVKDLQGKMALYERYRPGLGSRFPERSIRRAQWVLDFDTQWGTQLRRVGGWFVLLLPVLGIGVVWGADAAIKTYFVLIAIILVMGIPQYFYRQLKNSRPAWAAWLSGKGAKLFGLSVYALVVAIALFKLISWVAGWDDPIEGGLVIWIYVAMGLTSFVASRRKRRRQ